MKPVSAVARIKDPDRRMREAATLVRQAEVEAERCRSERDLAILVMLRPFADAVAATNAARADLRRRLDTGDLSYDDYRTALDANREQRQNDIAAAAPQVYPADVYKALGVSRNLVNRILMRMPNGALPKMADPEQAARDAHTALPKYEKVIETAREIRDTAALSLMAGDDGTPVTNAEVARATGLTTARIAQLREAAR